MVLEVNIDGTVKAKFDDVIRKVRILNWAFRWFGWILNPILNKFFKQIPALVFEYCSNCLYRHTCGMAVLVAGGITKEDVLEIMRTNGINCVHPNWTGVFKELENRFGICKEMKIGKMGW